MNKNRKNTWLHLNLVKILFISSFVSAFENLYLKDVPEFDFIVVGGGTGGCVVAARLAESGKHSVLLIHEGEVPNSKLDVPFTSAARFLQQNFPEAFKTYDVVPRLENVSGRGYRIGTVIGGGTSINGMFWNRGHPEDYNNWAKLTNDETWNYENMLKYFRKSENYSADNPTNQRGYHGPITISRPSYVTKSMEHFIEASLELGYPFGDPNGPQKTSVTKVDFSRNRGRRVSSFSGYIKPLLETGGNYKNVEKSSNLQILLNTEANRIIFEGNTATGVTFTLKDSKQVGNAKARKEIIVSAGTMDSAALLMRSGIGPVDILNRVNIPIVKALPVGENLHDHFALDLPVIYGNRSAVLSPARDLNPESWRIFQEQGDGPYVANDGLGSGAQGFFESFSHGKTSWPDLQFVPFGMESGSSTEVLDLQSWEVLPTLALVVARQKSRGRLTLNSISGPPVIDFRLLSHPDDVGIMLDGIKIAEKLCEETNAMRRIGCRISSTPLPSCSHLKFKSDSYWACFIRQKSSHRHHAGGTCRMGSGPEDPKAVVDSQLKVIGIDGLRVADASVMPQITNANTQAPVYAIAEKAADMILQKWEKNYVIDAFHF